MSERLPDRRGRRQGGCRRGPRHRGSDRRGPRRQRSRGRRRGNLRRGCTRERLVRTRCDNSTATYILQRILDPTGNKDISATKKKLKRRMLQQRPWFEHFKQGRSSQTIKSRHICCMLSCCRMFGRPAAERRGRLRRRFLRTMLPKYRSDAKHWQGMKTYARTMGGIPLGAIPHTQCPTILTQTQRSRIGGNGKASSAARRMPS